MTSSMAVYEPALSLSEEDFNPYDYAMRMEIGMTSIMVKERD